MSQPADYNTLKNRVRHLERREKVMGVLFRDLLSVLMMFADTQHNDTLRNKLDKIEYQLPPDLGDEF